MEILDAVLRRKHKIQVISELLCPRRVATYTPEETSRALEVIAGHVGIRDNWNYCDIDQRTKHLSPPARAAWSGGVVVPDKRQAIPLSLPKEKVKFPGCRTCFCSAATTTITYPNYVPLE